MKTIAQAVYERADEQEHAEFLEAVLSAVEATGHNIPAGADLLAIIRSTVDQLHAEFSARGGRKLRRMTVRFDSLTGVVLTLEPIIYPPWLRTEPPPQSCEHGDQT